MDCAISLIFSEYDWYCVTFYRLTRLCRDSTTGEYAAVIYHIKRMINNWGWFSLNSWLNMSEITEFKLSHGDLAHSCTCEIHGAKRKYAKWAYIWRPCVWEKISQKQIIDKRRLNCLNTTHLPNYRKQPSVLVKWTALESSDNLIFTLPDRGF